MSRTDFAIKYIMKILFITQVVDRKDPYLGFVHRWISAFAHEFDFITAVCLKKGESDLPSNVKVLSLGKEKKQSKFSYVFLLYRYLWQERKNYDVVFVHMNQEYVLLAGWWWCLTGKRVYLWRNHYAGSFLTRFAAVFCNKVFCTSKHSYTARFKKTVFMPVGVDTDFFKPVQATRRIPRSILFFARMTPSKRPDLLVEALGILHGKGIDFLATFVGDALPNDAAYLNGVKKRAAELGIAGKISWKSGLPNDETPDLYSAHDIFINLSPSGMFDKTIFEAMACGCLTVAVSGDLKGKVEDRFIFWEVSPDGVAKKLGLAVSLSETDRAKSVRDMRVLAESQGLAALAGKLRQAMSPRS